MKQMMAEEESGVPAVEVPELEVEQQVSQGDWVDSADGYQSCTVG